MEIEKCIKRIFGFLCLSSLILFGGCSTYKDYSSVPNEILLKKPGNVVYRIQSGDVLDIKFPLTQKHDEKVVVRPDGGILVEMAGEVKAAGKTPLELADDLKRLTSHRLKNPEVTVLVAESSQQIFVGGEVESEGPVSFRDDLTPLQAITERGGFKDTADSNKVFLIKLEKDTAKITEIDLAQIASTRLAANDVLFVPRTDVATVNLAIQQYIRNMWPVDWRFY